MNESVHNAVWGLELPVPNWKFVLIAIEHNADMYGFSSVDIDHLAKVTGLTALTVVNAIEGLKSRMLVLERTNDGQDGYQINPTHLRLQTVKAYQIGS